MNDSLNDRIRACIREVPDFPTEGILFKDITPLLAQPITLRAAIDAMALPFDGKEVTHVVGVESRGFLFGPSIALRWGVGFSPARKAGKLPWNTCAQSYLLEYGEATLELHEDAVGPEDRVLIVDDLLATGGTAQATAQLVESLGAEVLGCSFLIELKDLGGRDVLRGRRVEALIPY